MILERAIKALLPAPLHRALMPIAHSLRHRWRRWRGTPLIGVCAILTNPAGEVLLLRHSYGSAAWALPGGGVSGDEEPGRAIARELNEELGLADLSLQPIGKAQETISGSPHTAHIFAGQIACVPTPDGREIVAARFFSPGALPADLSAISAERIRYWRSRA